MTALAPLPELPGPEETQRLVRARAAVITGLERDYNNPEREKEIADLTVRTLGRTIRGPQGWSASLLGNTIVESVNPVTPYLLLDVLPSLCDWWERMALQAVRDCPPPDNVRLPQAGGRKMTRSIREGYDRWDIFVLDGRDLGNLHLPMEFTFNGQARNRDITWPFAPPDLIDPMAESIKEALGTQQVTFPGLRMPRREQPWPAMEIQGRKRWRGQRVFRQWREQQTRS